MRKSELRELFSCHRGDELLRLCIRSSCFIALFFSNVRFFLSYLIILTKRGFGRTLLISFWCALFLKNVFPSRFTTFNPIRNWPKIVPNLVAHWTILLGYSTSYSGFSRRYLVEEHWTPQWCSKTVYLALYKQYYIFGKFPSQSLQSRKEISQSLGNETELPVCNVACLTNNLV